MKAIPARRPPNCGSDHIAASGKMVDGGAWEHPFAGAGKPIRVRIEVLRQYLDFASGGSPECLKVAST